MSFIESIKTVLSKYAVFNGRARRSEFWWYYLATAILSTILFAVLVAPGYGAYMSAISEWSMAGDPAAPVPTMPGSLVTGYLIMSLVNLALLLPGLGVAVRRLHDTDRSGFWYFIGFVPVVGIILLLVWWAGAGTPGPNRFGPDPKVPAQPVAA